MPETEAKPPQADTSRLQRFFRACGHLVVYAILLVVVLWAVAALHFDVRIAWLRTPCIALYVLALVAVFVLLKTFWRRILASLACSVIVMLWWFSLKPSNNENWQADVSRTAYAEVQGNLVTIHNLRNCDYRAEFDYTCQWETKQVNLDDIRGLDLFLDYWGSPWIAHTILSFDFGNGNHVPFSIEARKQVGQSYSAVRGFFRQFTLISVISTERDVVRLRTNYRKDEDLYLYHTTATVPFARDSVSGLHRPGQRPPRSPALVQRAHRQLHHADLRPEGDGCPALQAGRALEWQGRSDGIQPGQSGHRRPALR